MDIFKILHSTNITIHVLAGSIALLLGAIALLTRKGQQAHIKSGRWFIVLLSIVIVTGSIGVFVFRRNTFLLVITILAGYNGFSGYRVLLTKSNKPKLVDVLAAVISLFSVLYFLYYFKRIGMIWTPVIIYSTVGALLLVISYDFVRYIIPSSSYKKLWIYEHIYKMIGAFSALLAAFTGTVFSAYQPYSQVLPSVFGVLLQLSFIIFWHPKNSKSRIL